MKKVNYNLPFNLSFKFENHDDFSSLNFDMKNKTKPFITKCVENKKTKGRENKIKNNLF